MSRSNKTISRYEKIVDQTDRITIEFKSIDKTVELDKIQVENLKGILISNIGSTSIRKFVADVQINLYSQGNRIGFLMVTENPDKPFVNFGSENLNFGFKLTYGIGRYLNETESNIDIVNNYFQN